MSGLISNGIDYYQFGIERALVNTAAKVGEELGSGAGNFLLYISFTNEIDTYKPYIPATLC